MAKLPDLFGRGVLASRPAAGIEGRHYVATDDTPDTMYRDNGSSWDVVATVGAGTVTTTRGDLIRRGASADERVALGATGKFLTSDGTDAVWGQGPLTTTGDLLIGASGGTPTRLAAGSTSGHVLTSNGSGAAPSWQAAAGGGGFPTVSQYGKTAIGGSSEATSSRRIYCKTFTLAVESLAIGISIYVTPNAGGNVPEHVAGISLDNAGTPGEIIAATQGALSIAGETSSPTSRWVTFPISKVLAAGTYWMHCLCAPTANSWTVFYDSTGTDKYYGGSGAFVYDGAVASFTTPNKDYSMYLEAIDLA